MIQHEAQIRLQHRKRCDVFIPTPLWDKLHKPENKSLHTLVIQMQERIGELLENENTK